MEQNLQRKPVKIASRCQLVCPHDINKTHPPRKLDTALNWNL